MVSTEKKRAQISLHKKLANVFLVSLAASPGPEVEHAREIKKVALEEYYEKHGGSPHH